MALPAGAQLGVYEIVALVGAGGMGEVYRARDTRLDRTVAIKVLPSQFAADPQLRDRFEREARAISSLNHPHICALYDVGEAAIAPSPESPVAAGHTIRFLVLEYLDGETVAERLARAGPLVAAEALQIATGICDALDRAHRSGIVHRDLKPANVMLTKSGAKLLDFGLAKSAAPVVAASGLSMLPTTPPNLTAQGTILGTFQYMAPEQIEGLEADARTDVFAFGALLFEILTGRTAFEGKTRASLLGAILKDEPPRVSTVQPLAPHAIDRIVSTCLAKILTIGTRRPATFCAISDGSHQDRARTQRPGLFSRRVERIASRGSVQPPSPLLSPPRPPLRSDPPAAPCRQLVRCSSRSRRPRTRHSVARRLPRPVSPLRCRYLLTAATWCSSPAARKTPTASGCGRSARS